MEQQQSNPAPQPDAGPAGYDPTNVPDSNMSLALIGGVVAALVGAALWAVITVTTGYQIGFMAIGVGFLVGLTVGHVGKGTTASVRHHGRGTFARRLRDRQRARDDWVLRTERRSAVLHRAVAARCGCDPVAARSTRSARSTCCSMQSRCTRATSCPSRRAEEQQLASILQGGQPLRRADVAPSSVVVLAAQAALCQCAPEQG